MIIARGEFPRQSVVPLVLIGEQKFVRVVFGRIVERRLAQFARSHVAIGHIGVNREIGGGAQAEFTEFLHAAVANIDEGSRLRRETIDRVAFRIAIHRRKFTAIAVIAFGDRRFVDLRAVLIATRLDIEGAGIEVLVHVGAVIPAFAHSSVEIERIFVQSKVIGFVIEPSVKSFLAELGERVDSIADVARGNGRF